MTKPTKLGYQANRETGKGNREEREMMDENSFRNLQAFVQGKAQKAAGTKFIGQPTRIKRGDT